MTTLTPPGVWDDGGHLAGYIQRKLEARRITTRWYHRPDLWAAECIEWPEGQSLADYQADAISLLPEKKRVALRGPHGTGKTTTAAVTVLWFAVTRDAAGRDWKVITTASAWRHLEVYLWPEIHKWANRLRWDVIGRVPFDVRRELMDLRLKLYYGAATAVASNDSAKIEGAHADDLLYLLDEAKIIPADTWDSIEGAFSGAGQDTDANALALALSTPGVPAGRFFDICSRKPGYEDWYARHVTLEEAIAAGRISREWAEQRARQWGKESAMYANRVLGEFHASDEDSVIPLAWVEAAVERWHQWKRDGGRLPEVPPWVGVDVGRGGDETVLAPCHGHIVTELETNRKKSTMNTVAMVQARIGRPIVDVTGIGAGVFDRLKETGVKAVAYSGAAKTDRRDSTKQFGFTNVRSAAYWHVRELLDPSTDPDLCLPPDDTLLSDLTAPTYDYATGVPPKIKIETKEDLVKRLGRSPDRGDAVVMALWSGTLHAKTQVAAPEGSMPGYGGLSPLGR